MRSVSVIILTVMLAADPVSGQSLSQKLTPLIKSHRGVVAVTVRQLGGKRELFQFQGDKPMPTASLIKMAIMVEAYRQADAGKIDLDTRIVFRDSDKSPGSGVLAKHFSAGAQLPLRDLIRLMMVYSDNSATNMVVDQVGLASTNTAMKTLGLKETRVHSKVFLRETSIDLEKSRQFGFGRCTSNEVVKLLEGIYRDKVASRGSCQQMLMQMKKCTDGVKLRRFLPKGTVLAQKGGSVTGVRCSAGIMFTPGGDVAVCVLTNKNEDQRWIVDNAGSLLCAEVGRTVFRHYNPRFQATSRNTLRLGGSGARVKQLQISLNQHLPAEDSLVVDGEFGPVTKAALIKFQKKSKLVPTGVADKATLAAIKLPPPKKPKQTPIDPKKFNARKLKRQPADKLDGDPIVTCKAWVIADAKSGKVLWSHNSKSKLHFASTTKIMTAYVVLRYAQKHPEALKRLIVFSKRADNTRGSSSRLRAGERTTVGEMFYGLLLPSGNDAAVALAEHFGTKLTKGKIKDGSDSLPLFVAAMNRMAKELGMSQTHYENPHGLTNRKHQSTALDLAKLSHAALKLPGFRKYVGTRQHATAVTTSDGNKRVVVWRNTNRLLRRQGFNGVKTGTTSAAGACLVSSNSRDGRQLLCVVLGSACSTSRYTDSRNLYRWAWRKLDR